ncbi:TRAF-type zinc finger domain-containing protein 1 isoform X1 [Leptinotarsa decemlineata]|uniref:TRAF-type zinc finger domain-containing protein 1 isoform X1 n=1 Tax=Leptinotarsa decemlineata TaxID=7539 RepID=UPI003D30C58C
MEHNWKETDKSDGVLIRRGLENLKLESMEAQMEHEICNNCKKEIPQSNYVMHMMHCARNISLCKTCKEPVPKAQFADHELSCKKPAIIKKSPPPTVLEKSLYFQTRKAVEDKKIEARKERYMQKMDRLVDSGYSLKGNSSSDKSVLQGSVEKNVYKSNNSCEPSDLKQINSQRTEIKRDVPVKKMDSNSTATNPTKKPESKPSGMLACKFCDLELPKLDLEDHENYCGTRTDKCLECGELVMFKNKQVHLDSNHGFVKLTDEPGPRPSWDSVTQRSSTNIDSPIRRRPPPFRPITDFDYDPMPYLPSSYQVPGGGAKKKEGESYKEISRRLDCKTEYIRNLLHDSAGITVPLRRSGAVPRNHFNHNKGPAPEPPSYRRRNPPTELVIPCEFCGVPVPHEDLIQHETGCRPDLARFNPRRRSPEPDDYFIAPQPSSPEVELPCEFCGDMIPASQLLGHQVRCS